MTKKTDTKAEATTSVVAPVTKRIGSPGVIAIGGTVLVPIAQFDKINGPIYHNDILLMDYDFTVIGDLKAKLNLYSYSVNMDGKTTALDLFILADELSSLDIEIPTHLDFQDDSFSVITLVNSASKNDYFRGTVMLVNVDTSESAFEDSIIRLQGHFYGETYENAPKNPIQRRIAIYDVDAVKLQFKGRQLPPGNYHHSDLFENVFVRGEREDDKRTVSILNSTLRYNSFREGDISIVGSTVSSTGFHFTGDVKLNNVTVDAEYLGDFPSVYLASKFDLTNIDVAGVNPAKMVRVDEDNVIITLPPARKEYIAGSLNHRLCTMSFRNPRSRRGLRNQVKDVLFGDVMPSEMEESVVDYFVETVMSRCSMMNLIDSARRLLAGNLLGVKDEAKKSLRREMGPMQREQTASVDGLPVPRLSDYGTSTSLANEYDKTIYIDSVGKF